MYYLEPSDKKGSVTLNPESKRLREELRKIVKYWVDKGVDGIRILDVTRLPSKTPSSGSEADDVEAKEKVAISLVEELRSYIHHLNPKTALLVDVRAAAETMAEFFGNADKRTADLVLNYELDGPRVTSSELRKRLQALEKAIPTYPPEAKPGGPSTGWVVGAPGPAKRLVDRVGEQYSEAYLMAAFLAGRGTPVVSFGDEIGERHDSISPLEWSDKFSSGMPWKEVPSNALVVEDQLTSNSSTLRVFKSLVGLRKKEKVTMLVGETGWPPLEPQDSVFAMSRYHMGTNGFLLLANLDTVDKSFKIDKASDVNKYLPDSGTIVVSDTKNDPETTTFDLTSMFTLKPGQAIVVEFAPIAPE
jgi:glycosidase